MYRINLLFISAAALALATPAQALSFSDAEKLARKSGCLKCHAPTREKDGASMKSIAEKWRDKADAEDQLYGHLTSSPMVEVAGKEEQHSGLKTDDEAQVRNVIKWYLSH